MPNSGTLKFYDTTSRENIIYYSGVLSEAALLNFANALSPYMTVNTSIVKSSFTNTNLLSIPGAGAGASSIERLVEIYLRDLDHPPKSYRLVFPSPSVDLFEILPFSGPVMLKSVGEQFAILYNQLTGRRVEFSEGRPI